jgi:hypothetical protein
MKIFRPMTIEEMRSALSHVHQIAHVHLVEKEEDNIGLSYLNEANPTVNRLLDWLPYDEPSKECWVKGHGGLQPVVAILLAADGVHLVLDRSRAGAAS